MLPDLDRIGPHRLLFVMATEHEYGPALRARIRSVITGVGPIEAAAGTAAALGSLAAAGKLPDAVVSLGSAGSRRLPLGEVFQISDVSWRNIDASPLGFARGVTPFADFPATAVLPVPLAGVPTATLSTGADVVVGAAYEAIDADLVDMETYAVWRACERFAVPLVGLRGVSDGAADSEPLDWTALLGMLDERLAAMVDRIATDVSAAAWTSIRRHDDRRNRPATPAADAVATGAPSPSGSPRSRQGTAQR